MNISGKKILALVFAILILVGIVAAMIYSKSKYNTKKCKDISCDIDYQNAPVLITPSDIIYEINKNLGKQESKKIGNIDLQRIDELLDKNPFLEKVNTSMSINGILKISAKQRVPILRYMTKEGRSLYLDKTGNVMPVYLSHPLKILVATGEISKGVGVGNNIFLQADSMKIKTDMNIYYNLHHVAQIIYADSILAALIEQVDVASDGYLKMITKAGSHVVMYGDTINAYEKFENLKYFYQNALPKIGWDKYKKINLQYKNQIVCTK